MRTFITVGSVVAVAWGITAVTTTNTCIVGGKAASGLEAGKDVYQPVAPVDILMDLVDEACEEAVDQLKAKKFSKVRKASYAIAEYMNVLQHHSSEEVDQKKMGDWTKIALEIRGDMLKAAGAAKKKDAAALRKVFSSLEDTCERCHDLRE